MRVDLTNRQVSAIDTTGYVPWGGGGGIGTALFWDLCRDKTVKAFDPGNVVTLMTSPLSGIPIFSGSSRTEVTGIGAESYPMEWYTRANFGGRFAAMLKYAGWDGIVVEGRSDRPVWIDIRDRMDGRSLGVEILEASRLWGLDTWETQQQICREIGEGKDFRDWQKFDSSRSAERTTQRPAIVAIGPAGETLCRYACLVHDAGNAAGQGGFGGVFGSKNLKAISVLGTGSVRVAQPRDLMDLRMQPGLTKKQADLYLHQFWEKPKEFRPQGCIGCGQTCRSRYPAHGNESQCAETIFSIMFNKKDGQERSDAQYMSADLAQKIGINVYPLWRGIEYLRALDKMGILGKGKKIDCGDLPMDRTTDVVFAEKLLWMIAKREGIGRDLAEGFPRAAEKWGRVQEDFQSGILAFPYWGYAEHLNDPRCEIEWGYGSILAERDCNEHCFSYSLFYAPTAYLNSGREPQLPAEKLVQIFTSQMAPYAGDMRMLDFSMANAYSEHMVKTVSWQKDYHGFYINALGYCDKRYPRWFEADAFKAEPVFYSAVTGNNLTFLEGMQKGRKIWTLKNALWTLQGRHRDMVHFARYIYEIPFPGAGFPLAGWHYFMPGMEEGKWKYLNLDGRHLDKGSFEEFKSKFYRFQGWDPKTGWPKRSTLESQGLKHVADELKRKGKLGRD